MSEAIKTKTYTVQFVVIHEVQVQSHDDIAAEKEAFQKMKAMDRDRTVASIVLEPKHKGGALESDERGENWKFARENFGSIDKEWLNS